MLTRNNDDASAELALNLFIEVRRLFPKLPPSVEFSKKDSRLLNTLEQLDALYQSFNEMKNQLEILKEILEAYKIRYGSRSPEVLMCHKNIIAIQTDLGLWNDALYGLRFTLRVTEKDYGRYNVTTICIIFLSNIEIRYEFVFEICIA